LKRHDQLLEYVTPHMVFFYPHSHRGESGRTRHLKASLELPISVNKNYLVRSHSNQSVLGDLLCAQQCKCFVWKCGKRCGVFTGIRVSAKTQQRLVHRQEFSYQFWQMLWTVECGWRESVRLRTPVAKPVSSDYKRSDCTDKQQKLGFRTMPPWLVGKSSTTRITTHLYRWWSWWHLNIITQDRQSSIGIIWMKICIKSGLAKAAAASRSFVVARQVSATLELFRDCKLKQAHNFSEYLTKHRHRVVNYEYGLSRFVQLAQVLLSPSQTNWQTNTDFRRAVESGKCSTSAGSPLCLSQWPDYYLNNLQGDMLP